MLIVLHDQDKNGLSLVVTTSAERWCRIQVLQVGPIQSNGFSYKRMEKLGGVNWISGVYSGTTWWGPQCVGWHCI